MKTKEQKKELKKLLTKLSNLPKQDIDKIYDRLIRPEEPWYVCYVLDIVIDRLRKELKEL